MVMPRSLKEAVGFRPSYFNLKSKSPPMAAVSRGAGRRGVFPSNRVMALAFAGRGRRSRNAWMMPFQLIGGLPRARLWPVHVYSEVCKSKQWRVGGKIGGRAQGETPAGPILRLGLPVVERRRFQSFRAENSCDLGQDPGAILDLDPHVESSNRGVLLNQGHLAARFW